MQMYHRHAPTGWSDIDGPLRPRAFDTAQLSRQNPSPWDSDLLLSNDAMQLRLWRTDTSMDHLVRNGDGDELLFIHEGVGDLFCDYGHLPITAGDYVILPRGTLWRIDRTQPLTILLLEATGNSYRLPDKGIVGSHAVFDPATLEAPAIDAAFKAQQGDRGWKVVVKRRGRLSTITYAYNPLDAVGWHGTLAPVRLNWRDIRPLMSHRYHVPPSAHTTFVAQRFVVCTFTPRPLESDPGALRVPFYHNNDDYDEIIFYHSGEFFSRDNIHPGMITLHPSGITHGPHPKAFEADKRRTRPETNEVAVMIDVKDASSAAEQIEWRQYADSWKTG